MDTDATQPEGDVAKPVTGQSPKPQNDNDANSTILVTKPPLSDMEKGSESSESKYPAPEEAKDELSQQPPTAPAVQQIGHPSAHTMSSTVFATSQAIPTPTNIPPPTTTATHGPPLVAVPPAIQPPSTQASPVTGPMQPQVAASHTSDSQTISPSSQNSNSPHHANPHHNLPPHLQPPPPHQG